MPLVIDPEVFFIGGVAFSWNSIALKVDGIPRRQYVGVDWEESIEREKTPGAVRSGRPFAMTYGSYDLKSLTLDVYPQEKAWIRQYLATKGGSFSTSRAACTIQIQLSESGYVWQANFVGCRLKSSKGSMKKGSEAMSTPLEFDGQYMTETDANGTTTLYDDLRDVLS